MFFRHNRFQSLVRQLNFYSFRKINRERNIWVYKHELFHRDHPENLFLVRRRTCPGLDGRKQRFSRFTHRRVTPEQGREEDDDDDADDSSSIESTASPVESSTNRVIMRNKRGFQEAGLASPPAPSKRVSSGCSPNSSSVTRLVDTSMVQPSNEISENEDTDDHTSKSRAERMSVAEQSMIVSEVAMKLEEYARKAMKGRSGSKSRRSGVVTPPTVSTSSLFTYDDEFDLREDEDQLLSSLRTLTKASISQSHLSPLVATRRTAFFDREAPTATPLTDNQTALSITNDMVLNSPEHLRSSLIAPTAVACFCMSTSPLGEKNFSTKILHLVASCDKLCEEFQRYLSALHPAERVEGQGPMAVLQRVWEREASREDAVREFRTFAVNCLQKLLTCNACENSSNQALLERTARVWRESIGFASSDE
jgi:hypothetical protein